MRRPPFAFTAIAVMLAIATGFIASACGGGITKVPNLPALQVTADKDVRASIMKLYTIMGALGTVLDQASQLEDTVAKAGGIPTAQDKAVRSAFVAAATQGRDFIRDVDSGALKDWTAIQARVNPIIGQINTLQQIAAPESSGGGWAALVEAAASIVLAIVQPGFFTAGDLVPLPAPLELWLALKRLQARHQHPAPAR